MTGIVYGLLAALNWGTADFLARFSGQRLGTTVALLWMLVGGGLTLGLALVFVRPAIPARDVVVFAILLGAITSTAYIFLYRAIATGMLSVVSPIMSSYAVVTVLLAMLTGERPEFLTLLGAFVTISGVAIAGTRANADHLTLQGVPEALGAAIGFGVLFWGLAELSHEAAALWIVTINRYAALCFLAAIVIARRSNFAHSSQGIAIGLVAGLCDAAAFLFYTIGVSTALVAVVAPLAALFGVVVVILARFFLRERLGTRQWIGLLLIFAGVVVVTASV